MLKGLNTYRSLAIGYFTILYLSWGSVWANPDQNMVSLTAQSLGSGMGNTAPSSAYNSNANEYLVVYAKTDASCNNERLFGIVLDAITGEPSGSEFPISDCNTYMLNPKVVYNPDRGEYGIFYKSSNGSGASLIFRTIDAKTKAIGNKHEFGLKTFSDPYENNQLECSSSYYIIAYHELAGASDNKLNLKVFNTISEKFESSFLFDKNYFQVTNGGLANTHLISNYDNEIFICFELMLSTGSEIHGGFIDILSSQPEVSFFNISPTASSPIIYLNPNAIKKTDANQILVVYEESHIQGPNAALNKKIKGQLISSIDGNKLSPLNTAISNLPIDNGYQEDAKMPKIVYSKFSKEFVMHFYGRRWINETLNKYHHFIQRINSDDLSLVQDESIFISTEIGTSIDNNFFLKELDIQYNSINNSFLNVWITETTLQVNTQIWRYDNNPPANLDISADTQNENLPLGTTFARLSAEDPDPEDATITYQLVDGAGSADNDFFIIEGDNLLVNQTLNHELKENLSILVRATDAREGYSEMNFPLKINDIPERPSNILIDEPLIIEENSTQFSSLISVIDEDENDSHQLRLVAGDSSDNNINFDIIDGNSLVLKNSLNYEDSALQYIRIEAKDALGNSKSKAFAIQVTDVNEPLESVYITPESIPENNPDAYVSIVIDDPDEYSNYSISFTEGTGDDDNTQFTIVDNKLVPNSEFNFEEKSAYQVRLLVKEGNYLETFEITINIEDINDAPDSVVLTNDILMSERGVGFAIGKFVAYDQDVGDQHTLTLTSGKDLFFIDNDSLKTKFPLEYNYENQNANFYNISVLVEDGHGGSIEKSFVIEVIPFADTDNPSFLPIDLTDEFPEENQGELTLSINANDNEQLDTAFFFYRPIRSSGDFESWSNGELRRNGDKSFNLDAYINYAMLDDLGLEYYFRIIDAAGNDTITPTYYIYKKFQSLPFDPINGDYDGTINSYRLITNPYDLGSDKISAIFSDYGPSNGKNWRLFKFENGETTEIGTNASATLKAGQGYWFNKSEDLKASIILEKPEALRYNRLDEKEIVLEEGWNLIGNPYPFFINWNNVVEYNDELAIGTKIYTYDKGYSEHSGGLQKFEGGLIYVENATSIVMPVLSDLTNNRIASTQESLHDWLVNFELSNGKFTHRVSGIGMHADASESFDRFDTPILPRFSTYADIAFEHPEHHLQQFTKDITGTQENYIWEFVATSQASTEKFTLRWTTPHLPGSDKQLMLFDQNSGKAINMLSVHEYEIDLSQPVPFKAIYGDRQFVKEILSNIDIQALRPYPNPFRSELNMPLSLPVSNHDYKVTCSIFNLMGERIFNQSINVPYGIYNVQWDDSESIDKGIYIYSIKINNKFITREFHGRLVKD
jgi:hypothetical protein